MREDYFNLKEAAKAMGTSDKMLTKIIKKMPSFPAFRVGGKWVIRKRAFYAFFEDEENCKTLEDTCHIYVERESLRAESRAYTQRVMHRGTLQYLVREAERNRRDKTHLEF